MCLDTRTQEGRQAGILSTKAKDHQPRKGREGLEWEKTQTCLPSAAVREQHAHIKYLALCVSGPKGHSSLMASGGFMGTFHLPATMS